MIPWNSPLPTRATEIFETAVNNIDRDTFKIASMASALETPRTIAEVELNEIQVAKKRDSKCQN
jgi:hypothetical protein